jgi:hypothetical protein
MFISELWILKIDIKTSTNFLIISLAIFRYYFMKKDLKKTTILCLLIIFSKSMYKNL